MAEFPEVQVPKYRPSENGQAVFAGGLNATVVPHQLAQDEVQSTTNIDYSLEWGGAACRRGNSLYANGAGTPIGLIARNYSLNTGTWKDNIIPWYAAGADGNFYTGSGNAVVGLTKIVGSDSGMSGGTATQIAPAATFYNDYAYLANGTAAIRTNGTNTFDWILPQADTPAVAFYQQAIDDFLPPFLSYIGSLTATEGTVVGSATSTAFGSGFPFLLTSATSGNGTRIVLLGTVLNQGFGSHTRTNWENPNTFITVPTGTAISTLTNGAWTLGGWVDFHQGYPNGDTLGTYTASATITQTMTNGIYATDYMMLGLQNQQDIVNIQLDLSIGDTSFTNYWTINTTPQALSDASADPLSLWIQSQGTSTFDRQIYSFNRSRIVTPGLKPAHPVLPPTRKTVGKVTSVVSVSAWAIARSSYQFIGYLPAPDFSNIQALRLTIEFNAGGQSIVAGGVITLGGLGYCLYDQSQGISYFQTYARVENGFIVAEGAPSAPTPATKCQYAHAGLVCTNVTELDSGITHRVFYRTGGLLQDAYRVGSCSIASGTATIYDYALPDMTIVVNPTLTRSLWATWPSVSAGTGTGNGTASTLPGVNAISQRPWQSRIWVGVGNNLYWTAPGQPTKVQDDTQTAVSDLGDGIQAIIPGWNLIVVNQNSVYEMAGTIFEGTGANWTLQRSMARRGCAAPRTCINTPYGILLFSYDGLSVYRQGYGIDTELDWVYAKIGDLWKGTLASDPAAVKGRIPALNQTCIFNACAAYKDETIYLAVPTGTNSACDTVFVLNLAHQKVWMYQYPFLITSLFFDQVQNRLMAGTTVGTIQQLEVGLTDASTGGTPGGIAWSFNTRAWSSPTDSVLENLQTEVIGTYTALGIVDNTNTYTLTTGGHAGSKSWIPASLQGTIGDNVVFNFHGTQSGTQQEIYQQLWDLIPQTAKVTYYRTDFFTIRSFNSQQYNTENCEGWWHETYVDVDTLGTATITATFFLDDVATATNTITYGGVGRTVFPFALPSETYGRTAYTILTAASTFKFYAVSYHATVEPPKILFYETAPTAVPSENYVKTWLADINTCGGTCTASILIDGTVALSTTFINEPFVAEAQASPNRKVFEVGLPNVTTAKNVKCTYTSTTPFKHYDTKYELEPQPFGKLTWLVTYKKAGGASQADMARFFAMDIEGVATTTITTTWIIDGTVFATNTLIFGTGSYIPSGTDAGEDDGTIRNYMDQIPFPPGGRGFLFQQQITATTPFKVWRANLDFDRIGIKGLTRVTVAGQPSEVEAKTGGG